MSPPRLAPCAPRQVAPHVAPHAVRRLVRLALLAPLACAAHTRALAAQAVAARDGEGRTVVLPAPARRIASVVPSVTDLLVALGARAQVVARTRYDTSAALRGAIDVGGGLDPDLERLFAARPDLVVAWRSQRVAPWLATVQRRGIPVFLVDTRDTTTFLATLDGLGTLAGRAREATRARAVFRREVAAVATRPATGAPLTGLYVVGADGVWIAGASSFVAQGLAIAGLRTPVPDVTGDFPAVSLEVLVTRDPDVLVIGRRRVPGEALATLRAKPGWSALRAVRLGRVLEVDGEAWVRPGVHFPGLVAGLRSRVDSLRAVR